MLAVLLVTALVASVGVIGADLLWLVALGREIVDSGDIPDGVPFAAAPSSDWPNVPVLAELSLWAANGAGERGLLAAQVLAVGVAIPGPVDPVNHRLHDSAILAGWMGIDVAGELGRRLDAPVHIDNDANLGAFAEARLGAAREARTAVTEATEAGAPQEEIDALQAELDTVNGQRDSLFRGETLRGLLLSAYAWSTVGSIAGWAAIGAFIAAALMAVLVVLGIGHYRKTTQPA